MNVTLRMAMERCVVEAALVGLFSLDTYDFETGDGDRITVGLHDGEYWQCRPIGGEHGSLDDIINNMHACDEEWLYVYRNDKHAGVVWLVYGNDGYDVLADHNVWMEQALSRAALYADALEWLYREERLHYVGDEFRCRYAVDFKDLTELVEYVLKERSEEFNEWRAI